MARIPETEIERIKRETDIIALVQSRGVALKQHGANWTGLCPFHDDRNTPNLIVTPDKGLFRCMAGGCGKSGNVIQFVEWFDGVSFRHAFDLLAGGKEAAFAAGDGKPKAKKSTVPKLPSPLEAKADDGKLLRQVSDYYGERLLAPENTAALDYFASRGLDSGELLRRFGVGFSDRTLGLRLPHSNRREGAQLRGKLMNLGVYRKTNREHLYGCVTVPVRGIDGEIRQIYGRRVAKAPKEMRHLYLARPLAGVFNHEALKPGAHKELILCESILDAMTFVRHGMEGVSCTFGTANFTDELFNAIVASKVDAVRLAFDGDKAGDEAAEKAAKRLASVGIWCFRIKFPREADANSYALDQGGEALKRLVRNADWQGNPSKSESCPDESSTSAVVVPSFPQSRDCSSFLAAKDLAADAVAKDEESGEVPAPVFELQEKGDFHLMTIAEREYRVGGLFKNNGLEVLKITLRVSCEALMHVDQLDLYRDGERRKFTERAHEETGLEKELLRRDLGKLLLALEQAQEARLSVAETVSDEQQSMSSDRREAALEFLKSPELIPRLLAAYDAAGVVGEATNKVAGYLVCASRLLDKPLAAIIQSTSAAGKTTLMEAVLSFFPEEEQIKYSAMTGQSLYYLGEGDLKHKILGIVEEEGAEKASYALKLLQSEGELKIASTGKDPHSGRMKTEEYHVEGPCAIMLTTTSIDIDEELMNRCLVLTVDESREQTERIHELQRKARTLDGLRLKKKRAEVLEVMRDAQRLLKPIAVVNPWADELTFTSGRTRTRRDHEKYLTLIEAITLLHQHQRPVEQDDIAGDHIRTTLEDIEAANRIAPEVLGRALDELPPQTRRLLEAVKSLVRDKMKADEAPQKHCFFSRRELREATGLSETQTRLHLERLEAMEYVTRRAGRPGTLTRYELLIAADEPENVWHVGLLNLDKIRQREAKKNNNPPAA